MSSASGALKTKPVIPQNRTAFASIALLLQGGGALGAYQAGVYEALVEKDLLPDWVGGISMGAINGAIIAGNKPADRMDKLHGFWDALTAVPLFDPLSMFGSVAQQSGKAARTFWNQMSASVAMMKGVPGFFTPRMPPAWFSLPGSPSATSFYDTAEFRETLEEFIDFDLLNSGAIRYTTSAVNVRTGNYSIFDSTTHKIGPEHIMASGALPPGLPAVEIEGQHYWDGGLISNTPLQWVMDDSHRDTLVFQVDLWSSRGEFPQDIAEVLTREKEIQYSSRSRAITEHFKTSQKLRHAFATLYDKLPAELKKDADAVLLKASSDRHVYNIVHLIYRTAGYEGYSKDCEFSQMSMEEHWKAGHNDTLRTLRHKEILTLPTCPEGIRTFDLTEE